MVEREKKKEPHTWLTQLSKYMEKSYELELDMDNYYVGDYTR